MRMRRLWVRLGSGLLLLFPFPFFVPVFFVGLGSVAAQHATEALHSMAVAWLHTMSFSSASLLSRNVLSKEFDALCLCVLYVQVVVLCTRMTPLVPMSALATHARVQART
jgi:hypothetical protein